MCVCVCVCVCVRACVDGMNLKYALRWHIHIYQFIPYCASATHAHTHTRILRPFEDSDPTGIKVDIAPFTKIHSLFLWSSVGHLFCVLQDTEI